MAKNNFKFKLKITGFELEVEGSKEDVASITSTVANQLKGLTTPPIIAENNETEDTEATDVTHPIQIPSLKKKPVRKSNASTKGSSGRSTNSEAIDFRNDSKKYSSPTSKWTTTQKALWTIYVVSKETELSELSSTQIQNTFNKHFKQSKVINRSNISRDLGKVKQGQKALVQENSTSTPSLWYLTSEGERTVQDLIKAENS